MSKRTRTRMGHNNPTLERNRRKTNNAHGRWSEHLQQFHWGDKTDPIMTMWYASLPGARLLKRLRELDRRWNRNLWSGVLKHHRELHAAQ
jgi:hypothetical protein